MIINLISNLNNGVGLQHDFELLKAELECRGHHVRGIQFNAPRNLQQAHVNVFLEVVVPGLFQWASQQWVVPNPEWWGSCWDGLPYTRVLAKTHDCEELFRQKFGNRVQYLGWKAQDLYDPTVPREMKCLHVAGRSPYKNTSAVVEGCKLAGVPLTVVSEIVAGAKRRVSDSELKFLMNSHLIHVMPSAYEGYGHALHESMGVGAVVITTNAPPMNEVRPAIRVPSTGTRKVQAATLHTVSPEGVAAAVQHALQLSAEYIEAYRKGARQCFVTQEAEFQQNLNHLLETL